jgi:hypothetical protein
MLIEIAARYQSSSHIHSVPRYVNPIIATRGVNLVAAQQAVLHRQNLELLQRDLLGSIINAVSPLCLDLLRARYPGRSIRSSLPPANNHVEI